MKSFTKRAGSRFLKKSAILALLSLVLSTGAFAGTGMLNELRLDRALDRQELRNQKIQEERLSRQSIPNLSTDSKLETNPKVSIHQDLKKSEIRRSYK